LDPVVCSLPESDADDEVMATHAILCAQGLGCKVFNQPSDLLSGNPRLSMGFIAQVTCTKNAHIFQFDNSNHVDF
jgi:hypothetical protein